MAKSRTIIEYERVYSKKGDSTYKCVKDLITNNPESEISQCFQLGVDVKGKYFKSRNYVGTVQINQDLTIEILPKIHSADDETNKKKTRRIFLEMLRATVNINYKTADLAQLSTQQDNILEVFITMFVTEAEKLIQRGLRCGYEEYSGNEHFYKGKLNIQQNIRENLVHKERFYVTYDVFSLNRSENRLIKSTLEMLRNVSCAPENQRRILRALGMMDGVPPSVNYEADFAKCAADRNMTGYQNVLAWAKVFLKHKSFTTYQGDHTAFALLFPMETVFENFIAQKVKAQFSDEYEVIAQKKGTYLFDHPLEEMFMLKPDIVMEQAGDIKYIIDTKWKLLNGNEKENYGISQADMYQMYAYAKKFNCNQIILCYPLGDIEKNVLPACFSSDDGVCVYIRTVDLSLLENPDNSEKIEEQIKKLAPQS